MLIQDAFEETARRLPHKIALIADAERISYAALDARAGALAQRLRERGVKRGDRVALFLDNGIDMAVAVCATLRAGAADNLWPSIRPAARPAPAPGCIDCAMIGAGAR